MCRSHQGLTPSPGSQQRGGAGCCTPSSIPPPCRPAHRTTPAHGDSARSADSDLARLAFLACTADSATRNDTHRWTRRQPASRGIWQPPRTTCAPLAGDGFCCEKPQIELKLRSASPYPELSHLSFGPPVTHKARGQAGDLRGPSGATGLWPSPVPLRRLSLSMPMELRKPKTECQGPAHAQTTQSAASGVQLAPREPRPAAGAAHTRCVLLTRAPLRTATRACCASGTSSHPRPSAEGPSTAEKGPQPGRRNRPCQGPP